MAKIVAYTIKEKVLLANLVAAHPILEDKRTDAATTQMKNAEWMKIVETYNAQADISVTRTDVQLKKLWNNLKQRKRKETTELKYERLKTGGGPPPEEHHDPVMEAVSVAAPNMDVSIPCLWDSTAHFKETETVDVPAMCTSSKKAEVPDESIAINDLEKTEPLITPRSSRKRLFVSTPSNSRINAKVSKTSGVGTECSIRIEKLVASMRQQEELHEIRMKIETALLDKANSEKRNAEMIEEITRRKLNLL